MMIHILPVLKFYDNRPLFSSSAVPFFMFSHLALSSPNANQPEKKNMENVSR
jgi:hypothetical protein